MTEEDTRLPIVAPFIVIGSIIVVISFLILFFSNLDKKRDNRVQKRYQEEVGAYSERNRESLQKLFVEVFDVSKVNEQCPVSDGQVLPLPCPDDVRKETIVHLVSNDLKDFSSTMFLKEDSGQIFTMLLSGHISQVTPYPEEREMDVKKLLRGEVLQIKWGDDFSDISGKEVIIPYRDNSGKVIGAIVRGVIEN